MAIASLQADYGSHVPYPGRRGLSAQALALAVVWITVALSSTVMVEPAPYDALMMGLIVLLPMLGLHRDVQPLAASAHRVDGNLGIRIHCCHTVHSFERCN